MSSLPLKPIEWREYGNINGTSVDAITPICEYDIYLSNNEPSYIVAYYNRHTEAPTKEATGFATIDEAKAWAWKHYNEKMQPYVKPAPTWIDVSERLPEKHTTVLVVYHAHFDDEPITEFDVCTAFFDGETFDPKDQLFYQKRNTTVTHWMPIPEFSTMQILHKGE